MPAKFSAYDTLMEYPSSGTLKVRYTQSQKWKAKFRASNGTEYLKKKVNVPVKMRFKDIKIIQTGSKSVE